MAQKGEGIPSAGLAGAEGKVRQGHGKFWKWSPISKKCEKSRKHQMCNEGVIGDVLHSKLEIQMQCLALTPAVFHVRFDASSLGGSS